MKRLVTEHALLLISLLVFGLLLARNPFSQRSLIGNLEPFPDSFHYLVPPRCFLAGQGWSLCRDGLQGIAPAVPPGYSITLLPMFAIMSDIRSFYLVNVALALVGLGIWYLIVRRLFPNRLVQSLLLLFYTTNLFTSWLPVLPMAENFLLPLFLLVFYMWLKATKFWHFGLGILFSLGLFFAKYIFLPTGIILALAFGLKLWSSDLLTKRQRNNAVMLLGALFTIFIALNWSNIHWVVFENIIYVPGISTVKPDSPWFSATQLMENAPRYWRALHGEPTPFLWDRTPLWPVWITSLGFIGLGWSWLNDKYRQAGLLSILLILGQMGAVSLFYAVDTRYILSALPLLVLGLGLLLSIVADHLEQKKKAVVLPTLVFILAVSWLLPNASRLKLQLAINFKYAETPWWQIATQTADQYFNTLPEDEQPYLATVMPPYLVDAYLTRSVTLLPLDPIQDFRGEARKLVWGEYDYSEYPQLYRQLMSDGHQVYISNAGTGQSQLYQDSFMTMQREFELELVQDGCLGSCQIFKLHLPENTP